jgi:hypothetical protein
METECVNGLRPQFLVDVRILKWHIQLPVLAPLPYAQPFFLTLGSGAMKYYYPRDG